MSFFGNVHESVLRKFILHNVDYVLIGGHAAWISRYSRAQKDIEVTMITTLPSL